MGFLFVLCHPAVHEHNEKLSHLIRPREIDYLWALLLLCIPLFIFIFHILQRLGSGDATIHIHYNFYLPNSCRLYFVCLSSFFSLFVQRQSLGQEVFISDYHQMRPSCFSPFSTHEIIMNENWYTICSVWKHHRCHHIVRPIDWNANVESAFEITSFTFIVVLVLISICMSTNEQKTIESTSKCRM